MHQGSVIAVEADIGAGQKVFDVCHKMGLDVRVFRDALDALMEAARSKPNVIVFDAGTPVLGSLDFADLVLRDPQFQSVALIAIVDEADPAALRRYLAHGIAVATTDKNDGRALRRELAHLLLPFVARKPCVDRGAHCRVPEKGAA